MNKGEQLLAFRVVPKEGRSVSVLHKLLTAGDPVSLLTTEADAYVVRTVPSVAKKLKTMSWVARVEPFEINYIKAVI